MILKSTASITKKKNMNLTASLYEDLMVEILLRLPVKSLVRFKCVCKSWLSLICSSQFAKSHFDLAALPSDRILFTKIFHIFYGFNDSIDLSDESVVSLRLPPPPPIHPFYTRIEFCGSCRGFVLLHYFEVSFENINLPSSSDDLIVWNPSTGEHKRVPHSGDMLKPRENSFCTLGFGYDASTDDYLVILINFKYKYGSKYKRKFMLFSFKTNSWNYLQDPYEGKELSKKKFYLYGPGLLLNGALHWFIISPSSGSVIVAFDLGKRRLSEIPLPPDRADAQWIELHTIGGCLGVSCLFNERTELWVIKDYNMLSSWTRLFASSYNDDEEFESKLFHPRPEEITDKTFESNFCLLSLRESGFRIVGINHCCRRLETSNTEDIINQGLCEHIASGGGLVLFGKPLWHSTYRESLLSLPNDSEKTTQLP